MSEAKYSVHWKGAPPPVFAYTKEDAEFLRKFLQDMFPQNGHHWIRRFDAPVRKAVGK